MPGLTQRNDPCFDRSSALYSLSVNSFWSKQRDDVGYNQLQKFWGDLSPKSRQELLKIDKQTLFEQARSNMYCSRCNGLLLEGFLQIVMYGKSLQQNGMGGDPLNNKVLVSNNQIHGRSNIIEGCQDEIQDPSVHPWAGLTTTRDGSLTLMDCFLYSKTLLGLQSVFDSARRRERERELLYPDACGGGGRGWISQGMTGYGRGHGTREACALHTAKLSCDTLVEFWSALGEETQQSLLRMKKEDFIERLMYRFDSKRFCTDCRRNVIREFKELKELKRMRREPQCTRWFCAADTAFQYEVSDCTIQADWRQTFADTVGNYNFFEWAVGTEEGKSDILKFENVGLNESVKVSDLNLTGLSSCIITLRAWKVDGRCTEFSVKAHALKEQQCVHCRLTVGDGFVAITGGDNIKMFFEHAEEAEEEEDDDSIDKDGYELDGECSRLQKHAKSPELAREFLLDAATVIFKDQVEKAFREGTARQNAHSIFVCLALKLLEERVHFACKEIITLEKQTKLLEEEEKEKREEEERKERRKNREREKKIRRKERLKGKEKNKDTKCSELIGTSVLAEVSKDDSSPSVDEEPDASISCRDSVREIGDAFLYLPGSPGIADELSIEFDTSRTQSFYDSLDEGTITNVKDGGGSFTVEQSKFSRRQLKLWKENQLDLSWKWSDRCRIDPVSETSVLNCQSEPRYHGESFDTPLRSVHEPNIQLRTIVPKSFGRGISKSNQKYNCSNKKVTDRYDDHSCSCSLSNEYWSKLEHHECSSKVGRGEKLVGKSKPPFNTSKQLQCCIRYNPVDYDRDSCGRAKSKIMLGNNPSRKELLSHSKKVWEPMESQKKYPRSKSGSNFMRNQLTELVADDKLIVSNGTTSSGEDGKYPCEIEQDENNLKSSVASNIVTYEGVRKMNREGSTECESLTAKSSISDSNETSDLSERSSFNPNISSSCPSVDSSTTTSSNNENGESSFTSDSEDANQHSEVVTSVCTQNGLFECHELGMGENRKVNGIDDMKSWIHMGPSPGSSTINDLENVISNRSQDSDSRMPASQPRGTLPPMQNQNVHFPMLQAPGMGYYHQNLVLPWPASAPNSGPMSFSHPNHYAGALGYGANGNSPPLCMRYGPLQHRATPVFNPGAVPMYRHVDKSDEENSKRMHRVGVKTNQIIPAGLNIRRAPPNQLAEQNDCFSSMKLKVESNSFSFFHFGGPAALSKGSKSNPLLSEERLVDEFSTRYNEQAYHKEMAVEEYNLFAASQGTPFSFF